MNDKIEVLINGEKKYESDLEYITGKDAIETIKMILEYAKLHKGSKIGMLKGLGTLK